MPAPPTVYVSVQDFGATANDESDDTVSIQAAINSATPGQTVVFPAGRYIQSTTIKVTKPGVTLWGYGATIHATNPDSQALLIKADRTRVYGFTLTAVTDTRRSEPWTTRIATFGRDTPAGHLTGIVIQQNSIMPAELATGTPLSNGASAAGILIHSTRDFTVASNLVRRSLADGIHVAGGSRNGRVIGNTVSETGDDGIAVVSYLPAEWRTLASSSDWIGPSKSARLASNVYIGKNNVSNQYWGRGITVVGGDSVTIAGNDVRRQAMAAGILVAREESNNTFGSTNVLIHGNVVSDIQTHQPTYFPTGPNASKVSLLTSVDGGRTRQGGIEVHSSVAKTDLDNPYIAPAVKVERVLLAGNSISNVIRDGIRIGSGFAVGGIEGIRLEGNSLAAVPRNPIEDLYADGTPVKSHCVANTYADAPYTAAGCQVWSPPPAVTGANLVCERL